jgi:hypothetical protein
MYILVCNIVLVIFDISQVNNFMEEMHSGSNDIVVADRDIVINLLLINILYCSGQWLLF